MKQIKERAPRWRSVTLQLLFLALLLGACEDEESKRHLGVLRQIAAETPVYPGFKQVEVSDNHKHGRARLFLYYNSPASYDEVKTFYSKTLLAKGWELYPTADRHGILDGLSESAIVFRQGEYQMAILQESVEQTPSARNFVILYIWEQR